MGDGNYISSSIFHNNLPGGRLFVERNTATNLSILRDTQFNSAHVLEVESKQIGFAPSHSLMSSGNVALKAFRERELEEPLRFAERYFVPKNNQYIITNQQDKFIGVDDPLRNASIIDKLTENPQQLAEGDKLKSL